MDIEETQTQLPMSTRTPTHSPVVTEESAFLKIPYEEPFWTFYSLDDHLPPEIMNQGNFIDPIVFSPDGIAWIGSSAGLWRYDKSGWTSFLEQAGMLSDSISSVAISKNGDVWVGSWEGVSQFDGDSWQNYPMPNVIDIAVSPNGSVWVVHQIQYSNGDLHRVVSLFDGNDWHVVIDDAFGISVNSIEIDSEGVLWLGTIRKGIITLNYGSFFQFPIGTFKNYQYSGGVCGLCVGAIEIAPDGTLWAMVANSGLVHFNGVDWTTYPYYTDGGPKTIAVSDEGVVWVGEVFGNVIAFMENEQWYAFTGLPFNKVYDIQIAPDGAVWFGTAEGLYIYRD